MEERTEQLINRKLDGELTDGESLELDKRLIRSPESRQLLAAYQDMDAEAGEALRLGIGCASPSNGRSKTFDPSKTVSHRIGKLLHSRLTAAAAAAVAVFVGGGLGHWLVPRAGLEEHHDPLKPDAQQPMFVEEAPTHKPQPTVVTDHPFPDDTQIMRDVFGVFDEETQSLYFLETTRPPLSVEEQGVNY